MEFYRRRLMGSGVLSGLGSSTSCFVCLVICFCFVEHLTVAMCSESTSTGLSLCSIVEFFANGFLQFNYVSYALGSRSYHLLVDSCSESLLLCVDYNCGLLWTLACDLSEFDSL